MSSKSLEQVIAAAKWELRPDYGVGAHCAWSHDLANALDWACHSCRDDVGWAKWERMERSAAGVITISIECGHCGSEQRFQANGEESD